MTWTTQKPTVPGWYWWRKSANRHPVMFLVSTGFSSMIAYLLTSYGKTKTYILKDELTDGQWSGPLEPPQDSEEGRR